MIMCLILGQITFTIVEIHLKREKPKKLNSLKMYIIISYYFISRLSFLVTGNRKF